MSEVPVGVLMISRELSQAYAVGDDSGDLLAMRMLKDAAVEKNEESYAAIEWAIRIGMGMEQK